MLLFHVNLLDPGRTEQGPSLFSGERLQEEVLIHLRVIQVDVVVGNVLGSESVGLLGLDCSVLGKLESRRESWEKNFFFTN